MDMMSDTPLQQLIFKSSNSPNFHFHSGLANKVGMSLKADIDRRVDAKHEVTTMNNLFYQPTNL
jgi:hypothetical protein